ncbi:hypothetical protein OXX59_008077 [Metschnikowia pulcherrima]
MSARTQPSPMQGFHGEKSVPKNGGPITDSQKTDSSMKEASNSSTQLPRDESSGLLSSLITAAHNAANMIKPKHSSTESVLDQRSFAIAQTESSKPHLAGVPSHSSVVSGASLSEPSSTYQPGTPENASLTPSNVHFEPLHSSPIQTLGEGDLSLVHFENNGSTHRPPAESAEVPIKGGPFMTESNSNKLLVSGNQDSKIVRRKSISHASIADSMSSEGTIDTDGADSHTFDPDEFSNLELDQILESPNRHVHPKKDKEFHSTFKKIPPNEHLLAEFSCALSRDILVQGKMYLSSHYICFNSNILGWVTNIVVPIQEIIQIEKKSTAVLFPNGMVIRTLHQKFVFATFLSRDTTFNMITQVWHNALQDGNSEEQARSKRGLSKSKSMSRRSTTGSSNISDASETGDSSSMSYKENSSMQQTDENDFKPISKAFEKSKLRISKRIKTLASESDSGSESDIESESIDLHTDESQAPVENTDGKAFKGFSNPGPSSHAPTSFDHEKADNEVEIMQHTFNAPLGVVYNMLFGPDNSTFVRVLEDGKNFDISKEKLTELNLSHKQREYSYTKPLGGAIGPKQTKCNITETLLQYDFASYCEVEQITKTPDVPSGNSFKVKTRIYLSWGPKNSTKMTVYTSVEWSAKSWIKSAVEKGSMDGQKSSMKSLTETITELINNGGSGAARKKRSRAKSGSQSTVKAPEPTSDAEPTTLANQIFKILDHIGSLAPVQIPMLSSSATGGLAVFVLSLMYSYVLTLLLGGRLFHGNENSSPKFGITGDERYVLVPSSELYLRDGQLRRQNEAQLWEWIAARSGAKNSYTEGQNIVDEKYADENLKTIMKITKDRIDSAYRDLV